MDDLQTLDLALFAAGAFAAAFVTGIAGFAFGVVAAAVWLHVLTPVQAAALIVVFGLIVQGWSVWKLRAALQWSRLFVSTASVGRVADGAVGVINGMIGGATGLAGIAGVVWCSMRGWSPAEQRATFQPAGIAVFAATALFGGAGMIGRDILGLFAIGLPALAIGTWAGLKFFGKLNDQSFRRIVLGLLLISGASLLVLGR
jgi:uncharacterized membrane protein YfcA